VLKEGRIAEVLNTVESERRLAPVVARLDDALAELRDRIRSGERIDRFETGGLA